MSAEADAAAEAEAAAEYEEAANAARSKFDSIMKSLDLKKQTPQDRAATAKKAAREFYDSMTEAANTFMNKKFPGIGDKTFQAIAEAAKQYSSALKDDKPLDEIDDTTEGQYDNDINTVVDDVSGRIGADTRAEGKAAVNDAMKKAGITDPTKLKPSQLDTAAQKVADNKGISKTTAGLIVVSGLIALGAAAATVILAWYANLDTGCFQIKDGVRGKQIGGGPATGGYYDWGSYPDICSCSPNSAYQSGATGASGIPIFCSGIYSQKLNGTIILNGLGDQHTGTLPDGTVAAGQPPYPVCKPNANPVCSDDLYYAYNVGTPFSMFSDIYLTFQQETNRSGAALMNLIQFGIVLAFIAILVFIGVNAFVRAK